MEVFSDCFGFAKCFLATKGLRKLANLSFLTHFQCVDQCLSTFVVITVVKLIVQGALHLIYEQ